MHICGCGCSGQCSRNWSDTGRDSCGCRCGLHRSSRYSWSNDCTWWHFFTGDLLRNFLRDCDALLNRYSKAPRTGSLQKQWTARINKTHFWFVIMRCTQLLARRTVILGCCTIYIHACGCKYTTWRHTICSDWISASHRLLRECTTLPLQSSSRRYTHGLQPSCRTGYLRHSPSGYTANNLRIHHYSRRLPSYADTSSTCNLQGGRSYPRLLQTSNRDTSTLQRVCSYPRLRHTSKSSLHARGISRYHRCSAQGYHSPLRLTSLLSLVLQLTRCPNYLLPGYLTSSTLHILHHPTHFNTFLKFAI